MQTETAEIGCVFSPRGHVADAIASVIRRATSSVLVALYDFTSLALAEELISAKHRGCVVKLVLEAANVKTSNIVLRALSQENILLYADSMAGLMHDKFAVIDGTHVITGSYNWTRSAEYSNAENVMIVLNAPTTSREFTDAFTDIISRSHVVAF